MADTTSDDASAGVTRASFDAVASRFSAAELEAGILDLWRERDVFRRSVDERSADNVFSFFEGPPTANGSPGIHHVLARGIQGRLIPRYKHDARLPRASKGRLGHPRAARGTRGREASWG